MKLLKEAKKLRLASSSSSAQTQISACGVGVVLGGSPQEPQGGREDLQDQVRAVPHGREGR